MPKGSRKKNIFLMAVPLRGGGKWQGPIKKNVPFLFCCHLKIKYILLKTTNRHMNGTAMPLRKNFFCGFPNS